jgi:4-hydroxy-3-polyprenylbenzoate decarboxylase
MAYKSLRDFIALLEAEGELKRVSRPVSTHLEMTEIQTRLLKTGGPAVLFENPCMKMAAPAKCRRWSICSARWGASPAR